jgi:hypothetical protein
MTSPGVLFTAEQLALFQQVGLVPGTNVSLDEELQLQMPSFSPHVALKSVIDLDVKRVARGFPALASLNATSNLTLSGPLFLQIDSIENANAPKRAARPASTDTDTADTSLTARRCLRLRLSDGVNTIDALELDPIDALSFDATPPGTKLVLRHVRVQRGWLLLTSGNVQVLGGRVEALEKLFKFQRQVAARDRSMFATRHHVRRDGDPGPPPFVLPVVMDDDDDDDNDDKKDEERKDDVVGVSTTRPSAKSKGKFAPMPMPTTVTAAAEEKSTIAAPAPAAVAAPARGKFAPMPTPTRIVPAVSAAGEKRGKFAPMPITPKMAAAAEKVSDAPPVAQQQQGKGRGRGQSKK